MALGDTVSSGGSYPAPLVAPEEPNGIITVFWPPAAALVALAVVVALVVLVAFVPCANISEGTIPTNDIVKMTDIMLTPTTEIIPYCFDTIKK
jgi:hypothetical protein